MSNTDGLREALQWYAEQVEGCRKLSPEGNAARTALDNDGGKRAREALAATPPVMAASEAALRTALQEIYDTRPGPGCLYDSASHQRAIRIATEALAVASPVKETSLESALLSTLLRLSTMKRLNKAEYEFVAEPAKAALGMK